MANPVKEKIARGEPTYGTMLAEMISPAVPQILKNAGYDWFVVDCEHFGADLRGCSMMIRCAHEIGLPIFFRIPLSVQQMLSKLLDMGATGFIIPNMETVAQAQEIIKWTKYPPLGRRGRGHMIGCDDYVAQLNSEVLAAANDYTMVAVQIETTAGVENCQEIFAVDGIDACFVGPADLSVSMGIPGQGDNPQLAEAVEKVFQTAAAEGVAPGIHVATVEDGQYWVEQGGLFVCYNYDIGMIYETSRAALEQLRG
ncbi:MAG: hypothetical protein KAW89_00720 [Armatimonadetes bacterium]|nr:hypothetical protein [Armatimonadota bacterium]